MTVVALVLSVAVSPKLQNRFVIVPLDVSVNVTANGTAPLVGVALKPASGTIAPMPFTALVELPPLAVVKMTLLVKPPAVSGLNCTVTLVVPPADTLNVPPDRIVYGAATVVVPLLTAVPPLLLTVNTACAIVPVASVPKLRATGLTPMLPGVRPVPVRVLVEMPPLLVNTTLVANVPAAVGRKLANTVPLNPGPTENAALLLTPNGSTVVAVPLSVTSPELLTVNASVLVRPIVSDPKLRLAGLTTNCAGLIPTIKLVLMSVLAPTGPLTVKPTVFEPAKIGRASCRERV